MSQTCANCGQSVQVGTVFCPGCGTRVQKTGSSSNACGQCGTANPPTAPFCGNCGGGLGEAQPRTQDSQRRTAGTQGRPYGQPSLPPQPGGYPSRDADDAAV
jgi:hypothetical protein